MPGPGWTGSQGEGGSCSTGSAAEAPLSDTSTLSEALEQLATLGQFDGLREELLVKDAILREQRGLPEPPSAQLLERETALLRQQLQDRDKSLMELQNQLTASLQRERQLQESLTAARVEADQAKLELMTSNRLLDRERQKAVDRAVLDTDAGVRAAERAAAEAAAHVARKAAEAAAEEECRRNRAKAALEQAALEKPRAKDVPTVAASDCGADGELVSAGRMSSSKDENNCDVVIDKVDAAPGHKTAGDASVGVVEEQEFVTAGGSKEEFDAFDSNGDGVLDANEMATRARRAALAQKEGARVVQEATRKEPESCNSRFQQYYAVNYATYLSNNESRRV